MNDLTHPGSKSDSKRGPMVMHAPPGYPMAAGSPSTNQEAFDPWLLWVTFRRCWTWAIPLGAVLAVIAAYVVFAQFVPKYRATHTLEVNQDHVVFKGVLPTGVLARTERHWITNPLVLQPVLADERVRGAVSLEDPEQAEENLRRNLSVSDGGTRTLLMISYTDENREAAADVCNAIVDSYLKLRDTIDKQRIDVLEDWIQPAIDYWQNEMEGHQERIFELSKQVYGYAPEERVAAVEHDLSTLKGLRSKLASLRVEQEVLKAEIEMQAAMDKEWMDSLQPIPEQPPEVEYEPKMPSDEQIAELVAQDGDVREAQALINRREKQMLEHEDRGLMNLRRDYYDQLIEKKTEHEEELKAAIEAARKVAIAKLQADAERQFYANVAERHKQNIADREAAIRDRRKNLADMRRTLDELVSESIVLQEEYESEKARLEQYGGRAAELAFAKEDKAVASEVLTKLKMRVAAITTERRRGAALQTVAPAEPPNRPIEEAPWKKIFVFSSGAFLMPFFLGLLWEFKTQRVTDSSKMQNRLAVPVVGEVSRLPAGSGSGRSQRVFEESIDSLRANLFLSRETAGTRSIAIASSMSGEGKSSVASQLAVSIAKATGETVLLVDADLRSPDQHDIFGLEMGPGLCKVLSGEVELGDAIDKTLGDLVHVLPAGRLNDSPHRLLSTSAMRDLMDTALETYGYVVVDTAPVLAAGESLAVAASVDVTLLCVLRDVSRIENVSRTTRRLEAAGATLAGTVFSGVPARQYAYRYGDYRYITAS